ncbi:hypothetical protein ACJX0J_040610 [Zea mays]
MLTIVVSTPQHVNLLAQREYDAEFFIVGFHVSITLAGGVVRVSHTVPIFGQNIINVTRLPHAMNFGFKYGLFVYSLCITKVNASFAPKINEHFLLYCDIVFLFVYMP